MVKQCYKCQKPISIKDEEPVIHFNCGHLFHYGCLGKDINQCPVCAPESEIKRRNTSRRDWHRNNPISLYQVYQSSYLDMIFDKFANKQIMENLRKDLCKLIDLSEKNLKGLEKVPFSNIDSNMIDGNCSLCGDNIKNGQQIVTLECNHVLHKFCFLYLLFFQESFCLNCNKPLRIVKLTYKGNQNDVNINIWEA